MTTKAVNRVRAAAVALLLSTGTMALHAPSASAADFGCTSKVTKAYKSGGTVIGVIRLECPVRMNWMRVSPVIDRTGGGQAHKTFYKPQVVCYDGYSCTATFGVADVSGSNKYWITNEPTSAGTAVDRGGEYGYEFCFDGIDCRGWTGYF